MFKAMGVLIRRIFLLFFSIFFFICISLLISACQKVEITEEDMKSIEQKYPFLTQRYSPAHLFIDKINGYSQIVPSQSLFDIEISYRLGFKAIELNIHQTSDGKFVCIHGVDGKFGGQVEHIDGITDISEILISKVSLSYIQDYIRYKSSRVEYKTTIPTLEECCELCRKLGMTVSLGLTGVPREDSIHAINICRKYFKDSFMVGAYGDEQAKYLRTLFSGAILNWSPTIEPSEIERLIPQIGTPYIHCIQSSQYSDETSDDTFKSIVNAIHSQGGYAGFSAAYTPESLAQRMWNCGFDIAGPSYNINEFEGGNICQLVSDRDFIDFTTTGSVINGSLSLKGSEVIMPNFVFPSNNPFLAGGILKLCFTGRIIVEMGHIDGEFSSDGQNMFMLSSYFLSERPSFKIKAVSDTYFSYISYQASTF